MIIHECSLGQLRAGRQRQPWHSRKAEGGQYLAISSLFGTSFHL